MPVSAGGTYAKGSKAYGYCDRCGFRYPLFELKPEYYNRSLRHNRVCPECWDPDHPQLRVGLQPLGDPRPLNDPRPDNGLASSRGLFGWDPALGASVSISLGTVTVETT